MKISSNIITTDSGIRDKVKFITVFSNRSIIRIEFSKSLKSGIGTRLKLNYFYLNLYSYDTLLLLKLLSLLLLLSLVLFLLFYNYYCYYYSYYHYFAAVTRCFSLICTFVTDF